MTKQKLRPVIKVNESKTYLAEYVVEKFPENYREMTYLEPFVGGGSVLLAKDPSVEEIANDIDGGIANTWRAIKDEGRSFVSKVKTIEYNEGVFQRFQKKNETDYLKCAIKDFALRHMSKSGLKKTYLPKEKNTKCKDCWCDMLGRVPEVSERVKDVFFLNKDALGIIKAFSHANALLYCDPPSMQEKSPEMDANKHMELSELLKEFRGKVIISAANSALYKRLYGGWTRKGVPGRPKESLWLNF